MITNYLLSQALMAALAVTAPRDVPAWEHNSASKHKHKQARKERAKSKKKKQKK